MASFQDEYAELRWRFEQQVTNHRQRHKLEPLQEIFLPMAFWPRMPDADEEVEAVFIGMYPSQNWVGSIDPAAATAGGFKISLSTIWDLVFHLAVRQFLCRDGEIYYVTDIAKGAMEQEDERRTREWGSWYPLLVSEMRLVLGGNGTPSARVVPVGNAVNDFLGVPSSPQPGMSAFNPGFGRWLEMEGLGRLTRRVTHWAWAPRQHPPSSASGSFFNEYGSKVHHLAAQLLDEADADEPWVQHVYANLEKAIQDPRTDRQCGELMKRYGREFSKISQDTAA